MAGQSSEESIMTLDSIHRYYTIHTNLRSTYGTQWEPWEAFRELVQNWRDGIIRSFDLNEIDFTVIREQKSQNEIIYKVPVRPNTQSAQYLGYLRFSGNMQGGRVELVNRKATIQPSNFDLGGTTKQKDSGQAGEHGDGLKVALLVLMRAPHKHSICFNTGGFHYDIVMEARSSKPDLQEGLIPVAATPQDDIKFIIGLGNSVTVQDFNNWAKAALFLQQIENDGIISTPGGDLITSATLRGNIYLKGLLLKSSRSSHGPVQDSASITGKPLRFGYNFADGSTNRDRQSLAGAKDEARAIFSIWADVLPKNPNLIGEMHEMLNSRSPDYADVSQARYFLCTEITNQLKIYLFLEVLREALDCQLARTIRSLGREPHFLEENYWDILHSRRLVRTAEEEKRSRFLNQKEQTIPNFSFSKDVHWYLSACLRSCTQTEKTRLMCVEGVGLDLTTMWEEAEDLVRITKSWFLHEQVVAKLGVAGAPDAPILFLTVKQLFRSIIHQLAEGRFGPRVADDCPRSWYKERAVIQTEQRLHDCIQLKKSLSISMPGPSHEPKLRVTCGPGASWKPSIDFLHVEVHQVSTCAHLKDILLAGEYSPVEKRCILNRKMERPPQAPVCGSFGCYYKPGDGEVTFSALKEDEQCFAVIYNSSEPSSFIVVSENTTAMPRATTPPPPPTPVVRKRTYTLGKGLDNINIMTPRKWYKASNAKSQEAVVGIPLVNAPKASAKKTPVKRSAPQSPTAKRVRSS
ncbi:hypothetical protein PG994_011053 [Apiospora phragmitis]|uniref:Uncharacterized protein n=1 Tax=Apiospora phragmitis TaxID=2905665 RepID=A0ABR1TUD0_9PEZI